MSKLTPWEAGQELIKAADCMGEVAHETIKSLRSELEQEKKISAKNLQEAQGEIDLNEKLRAHADRLAEFMRKHDQETCRSDFTEIIKEHEKMKGK